MSTTISPCWRRYFVGSRQAFSVAEGVMAHKVKDDVVVDVVVITRQERDLRSGHGVIESIRLACASDP